MNLLTASQGALVALILRALEQCPMCVIALAGGSVERTREVIDLPLTPVLITEHVYLERCCHRCGRRQTPAVDLEGGWWGRAGWGPAWWP